MSQNLTFAFVDLAIPGKKANRDHTGTFGSFMDAKGGAGRLISTLKARCIELPILSFGTCAAILRNAGHHVNFYRQSTLGEDVILIASSMHCHQDEIEFAKQQKEKFPQSKIGFYGAFSSVKPELFREAADFIIFGEVEGAFFGFVRGEHSFEGDLQCGLVMDMDTLPIPSWEGLDLSGFNYFPLLHKRPFMSIQSSRGCSFDCDFCPYMVTQTKRYRMRTPELVVDEMQELINRYGIKSFLFRDICFTLNKKHAERISRIIIERGLKIEWACETRIDCLTPELMDVMVESGWRGVNIGLETGNIDILKDSGKRHPAVTAQEETIEYMHKKGVRIQGFYMLGLIGDTPESMQRTIDYAESLNTLGAQFCTMTPFPGTKLYDRIQNQLLTKDFSQFSEYQPVVNIETASPQQVTEAAARAYRYYFRWVWLKKYGVQTFMRIFRNQLEPLFFALFATAHDKHNIDNRGERISGKESEAFSRSAGL